MKPPDPIACAQALEMLGPPLPDWPDWYQAAYKALEFCAREPEGIGTNQRILGLRAALHGVLRALRNEDIGGARERATEAIGLDDGAIHESAGGTER